MATVKMIRGSRIADIFDSPETIAQAEKDGFVRMEEKKSEKVVTADSDKADEKSVDKTSKWKRQLIKHQSRKDSKKRAEK